MSIESNSDFGAAELLRTFASTGRAAFLSLITVGLLVIGVFAILRIALPTVYTYAKTYELVFTGAEKKSYPSGQLFSLADIVAPHILAQVYEANRVSEFGLTLKEFGSAINIEPYAPNYISTLSFYQNRLANPKLAAAEREQLESELEQQLALIQSRRFKIKLTLINSRLPPTLAEKILADVVKAWSEYSINKKGALNQELHYVTAAAVSSNNITELDFVVAWDYVNQILHALKSNIQQIEENREVLNIKDGVSSLSIRDLKQHVLELETLKLPRILASIRQLGPAANQNSSVLFLKTKQLQLTARKKELSAQSTAHGEAYDRYIKSKLPATESPNRGEASYSSPASTSQIGDPILNQILTLASDKEDQEYRQRLIDEKLAFEKALASVDTQITEVSETLSALRSTSPQLDSSTGLGPSADKIRDQLRTVTKSMQTYISITTRMFDQINTSLAAPHGKLYAADAQPMDVDVAHPLLSHWFVILALFVLVATAVLSMLWSAWKNLGIAAHREDHSTPDRVN